MKFDLLQDAVNFVQRYNISRAIEQAHNTIQETLQIIAGMAHPLLYPTGDGGAIIETTRGVLREGGSISRRKTKWQDLYMQTKQKHPGKSFKEVLQMASKIYRK